MAISGLEDEFNIAREVGMPRLIYVSRQAVSRDNRLVDLIERAKNEVTIYFYYDEPVDLRRHLRDDITAVVASSFHPARQIEPVIEGTAAQFIDRLVPPAERLPRNNVERELSNALHEHHILEVQGELGVGKTVLLAALGLRPLERVLIAELLAGGLAVELPVDLDTSAIAPPVPSLGLAFQHGEGWAPAAAETTAGEPADGNFSLVQPTSVLWGVVQRKAAPDSSAALGTIVIGERLGAVEVQVVHH